MDDPLDSATLQALEASLRALETQLSGLLRSTESDAKPTPLKDNASRLSRMDEMHNQSILRANRTVTQNRLLEVRRAIVRIQSEQYGICQDCFNDIAIPRLKAYPEATLCILCKDRREKP